MNFHCYKKKNQKERIAVFLFRISYFTMNIWVCSETSILMTQCCNEHCSMTLEEHNCICQSQQLLSAHIYEINVLIGFVLPLFIIGGKVRLT